MVNLVVGVCHVSLLLRYARSLKDKRRVVASLTQKLRNQGFSVTECAYADNPKQASLGFAYVASSASAVRQALDDAERLFIGDFEVLSRNDDIFDYSEEETTDFEKAEEEDPRQG